jgi:hypothetical protein
VQDLVAALNDAGTKAYPVEDVVVIPQDENEVVAHEWMDIHFFLRAWSAAAGTSVDVVD